MDDQVGFVYLAAFDGEDGADGPEDIALWNAACFRPD